jgi:hypothetical protein
LTRRVQCRSKDAWCAQSAQIQDPPTLSSVDRARPRLPPRAPPLSVPLLVQFFPCRQPFRPPARPPESRLLSRILRHDSEIRFPAQSNLLKHVALVRDRYRGVRSAARAPRLPRPLPAVAVCPTPFDTDAEIIRACRVHQASGEPLAPARRHQRLCSALHVIPPRCHPRRRPRTSRGAVLRAGGAHVLGSSGYESGRAGAGWRRRGREYGYGYACAWMFYSLLTILKGYAPCCASIHPPQRDAAALPRSSPLTLARAQLLRCAARHPPSRLQLSSHCLHPPPLSESPFAGAPLERERARPQRRCSPPPDLSPAPHRPCPRRAAPACAAYLLTRSAFTRRERHPPYPRFISIDLCLLTSRLHHIGLILPLHMHIVASAWHTHPSRNALLHCAAAPCTPILCWRVRVQHRAQEGSGDSW